MKLPIPLCLLLFAASGAWAELPAGAGHDETVKVCGKCHSPEQAASMHQSRTGWEETVSKMVNMGAEGTDAEYEAIVGYLTKNFGPEAPKPLNANTASAVEFEAVLAVSRAEAAAIIEYRTSKGPFKSADDFKGVPGLDLKKIEAKKSRLVF